MTGVILSGGENSRLPYVKVLLTVEGKTIIGRSLDVLGKVFDRTVMSTNSPELYFRFGVPMIGDVRRERGPMIGILSVLAALGDDAVFVVACDMPFINEGLIRHMADAFQGRGAARKGQGTVDAVVPFPRGMKEPLFAIYSGRAVGIIEQMLGEGKRGLIEMLDRMDVLYIPEENVMRFDPMGRSFVNINTMEDYRKTVVSRRETAVSENYSLTADPFCN